MAYFQQLLTVTTACDVAVTDVPFDVETINVYPNPMVNNLQVAIDLKTTTNLTLKLYDVSGKVLLNQKEGRILTGQTTIELRLSDLASGIYLLGIETDKGHTVRRVVKFQ